MAVNIKRPRTDESERETDPPTIGPETSSDDENACGSEADTELEESATTDDEEESRNRSGHQSICFFMLHSCKITQFAMW